MGKAAAAIIFKEGGTPWLIGRSESKLLAAQGEISPSAPDLVKISSVDVMSEDALKAFFDGIKVGSFHHMVLTVGDNARCTDVRGMEGFSGLRMQFDLKFFAQVAPVSFGVDKMADCGSIVFTSGTLSRRPGVGTTAICATNAALEAIVKVAP
jgi:NAD(P)-dependent dehydrogenase (short-subunit alcohol dehydrogenase family)